MSPKAALAVPGIVRLAVEVVLFVGAVWMLRDLGRPWLAAGFAGLVIIQTLAAYDRIVLLLQA